jgi:hypothetical protein
VCYRLSALRKIGPAWRWFPADNLSVPLSASA